MKKKTEAQIAAIAPLLAVIRKVESDGAGGYRAVWGGIDARDRPEDVTGMTFREVKRWQRGIVRLYASSAVGAYQCISATLAGAQRAAGIPDSALFDECNQDRIALRLLKGRGLDAYLAGELDLYDFANALAKEWAGLPVVTDGLIGHRGEELEAGQSYYDGDGLNSSRLDPDEVIAALRAIARAPAEPAPRERILQSGTVQKAIAGLAVGGAGVVSSEAVGGDGLPALDLGSVARDLGTAVETLQRLELQNNVLIGVVVALGLIQLWQIRDRLREWWDGRR